MIARLQVGEILSSASGTGEVAVDLLRVLRGIDRRAWMDLVDIWEVPEDATEDAASYWWAHDPYALDVVDSLMETLEYAAPPLCLVGAHPEGGVWVWPSQRLIAKSVAHGDTLWVAAGTDWSESVDGHSYVLVVGDDGSMTLYKQDLGGNWIVSWTTEDKGV